MQQADVPERFGVSLAILAAFGFSFKAIFVKLAYASAEVDAVTLLTLRMLFAFPIFFIVGFSALRGGPALTRKDWLLLVLLGLAGYYGASILDFMGLAYITAGLERLILFTYPTLTILLGVLFLGKRFDQRLVLALLLCSMGISLACATDFGSSDDDSAVLTGVLLIFGSALAYAFYSAFSEVSIKRLGSMRFSVLAMLVSILAVQTHFLLVNPLENLIQPMPVYLYCAAMAVFSTVLPVFFQSAAVRRIGAPRTVLIGTLGPVLTLFFSWLILTEPLTLLQFVGTALVIIGVMVVNKPKRS
ncbi:DMT family transporter [Bowmanella sp. Y26]|uniref:DMT family transporter n=1 Tax=Bowmanella yangjiangensis TaxID=2811230 RepID=UPI001BDBC04C|nr:DMT family transporter [Bowmanella yangjiangensis]MBT1062719.1 DMT family transporter [Bowmanella yangjiangensis]